MTEKRAEKAEVTLEELELTATLAQKTAEYVLERGMPTGVDIISINVPEKADPKKVKVTSLSYKGYGDLYTKQKDGYRIAGWALSSYPNDRPGTDIHAIKEGRRISITPIKIELPHNKKELENLLKTLTA